METMKNAQLRKLKNHEESFKALQDFTDESNWNEFYTIRGMNDSFDWYAEWPELKVLLTENLLRNSPEHPELQQPENLRILVPACGNSSLSGHLYDFGFRNVLNLDFSKVVITNMMRKNLKERPAMKWRVRNITDFKLPSRSIDAVVDKGGLDCLMDCIPDSRLGGDYYLIEVKRVLVAGGKFICITLAESLVIDVLLRKFRFGWKTSLHTITQDSHPEHQIFAFVAEKDSPTSISELSLFLDNFSGDEARELLEALDKEKRIRTQYDTGCDVVYSLEDLVFGAKGNISVLEPGRRVELILNDPEVSYMSFRAILLDSKEPEGFTHHLGVLLVPYLGPRDSPFETEKGQWDAVIRTKTARLLVVFLDSSNFIGSYDDIKADLDILIKPLRPVHRDTTIQTPLLKYMHTSDGIRTRKNVYEVTSNLTGKILVEDATYAAMNEDGICDGDKQRRLIFLRTRNLVQSAALLSRKALSEAAPKRKKKGKQRKYKPGSSKSSAAGGGMEVVHNVLDSEYHKRIISGVLLISAYFFKFTSHRGEPVKTVVIGLGAGLLPIFMKSCLSSLKIEVVELDPVVLDVASAYFGFKEDERLKVHIGGGIEFVKEMANFEAVKVADTSCKNKQVTEDEEESCSKVDILVVDVDSSDLRSGLACPTADFVDESFLRAAKETLSERGVLIMNLITRSSTSRAEVYSRLKTVFRNVLRCDIQEDVYEVIFALKTDSVLSEDRLSEARNVLLERLEEEEEEEEWNKAVLDIAQSIKPLR